MANAMDRFDGTLAAASGIKRPISMGSMDHLSGFDPAQTIVAEEQKVSRNITEFIGAIEDDEDEPFFF